MYNWSTDTSKLSKNPEKWERFQLEQQINFGLNHTKISTKLLKKHWDHLNLDPHKKAYLHTLLWPDQS